MGEILAGFGARVKHYRTKRKLTQEQLGYLSGISRNRISDVENGRHNLALMNASRIADALNVRLYRLMPDFPLKLPDSPLSE